MANLKSSQKDIRRTIKRTKHNSEVKSRVRTFLKKARAILLSSQSFEEVMKNIVSFESIAMKAARKEIINRKTVSRLVSRLVKKAKIKFNQNLVA